MHNTKRKGVAEALAPYLLLIMLIIMVIIAILAYLQAMSAAYEDKSKTTTYALHAMLESTECTPVTKLPFRDVLAIGLGEGKTGYVLNDEVQINYGGKTESVYPADCFGKLSKNIFGNTGAQFYVEYPALCTPSAVSKGCFQGYSGDSKDANLFNIEASEYIAVPNGDVARVVLKTKG